MAQRFGLNTRSIHAGEAPDPSTGANGVPIYQNATFAFRSYQGVEAWRNGAPTISTPATATRRSAAWN